MCSMWNKQIVVFEKEKLWLEMDVEANMPGYYQGN